MPPRSPAGRLSRGLARRSVLRWREDTYNGSESERRLWIGGPGGRRPDEKRSVPETCSSTLSRFETPIEELAIGQSVGSLTPGGLHPCLHTRILAPHPSRVLPRHPPPPTPRRDPLPRPGRRPRTLRHRRGRSRQAPVQMNDDRFLRQHPHPSNHALFFVLFA
jgi:hypothetical protein